MTEGAPEFKRRSWQTTNEMLRVTRPKPVANPPEIVREHDAATDSPEEATAKRKEPEPNYRCLAHDSNEPSGCPDFYIDVNDRNAVYACPRCGNRRLIPLY